MSEFFDSNIIQDELKEINDLQEEIYGTFLTFSMMDPKEQLENVEKLSRLLEKQKVMYTRLSLSDDPQAVEMKENLRKSVITMGFPPGTDLNMLFNSMKETIDSLKNQIDS